MEKVGMIVVVLMLFPMAMATAEGHKEGEEWFREYNNNTTSVPQQKVTQLHFYTNEIIRVTKALVAQPNITDGSPFSFGKIYALDSPLTVGPSLDSKVIGRCQGLSGATSLDKRSITIVMAFVLNDGPFNGSSFTILGYNPYVIPSREMAVIGGSGVFRLARGFALLSFYFIDIDAEKATISYNVTIYHN